MPSSKTSRRLKRDRSARVSGKILGSLGERKAEFIDFRAQNCISEALLAVKWAIWIALFRFWNLSPRAASIEAIEGRKVI
jgi:hypothetical protein